MAANREKEIISGFADLVFLSLRRVRAGDQQGLPDGKPSQVLLAVAVSASAAASRWDVTGRWFIRCRRAVVAGDVFVRSGETSGHQGTTPFNTGERRRYAERQSSSARQTTAHASASGNSAIILSAKSGNDEAVTHLINAYAILDLRNGQGYTALMNAARVGHERAVKALLSAGANLNLRNNSRATAYDSALIIGHQNNWPKPSHA